MPELHGCNGVKPYALAKSNGRTLDLVRSEHLLYNSCQTPFVVRCEVFSLFNLKKHFKSNYASD